MLYMLLSSCDYSLNSPPPTLQTDPKQCKLPPKHYPPVPSNTLFLTQGDATWADYTARGNPWPVDQENRSQNGLGFQMAEFVLGTPPTSTFEKVTLI